MIAGFILGFLTFLSAIISFHKMPVIVQNFFKANRLFTDVVVFTIVFITLSSVSKSIVAIFGATVAGLLIDLGFIMTEYMDDNPDVKERLELRYEGVTGKIERKFREIVMK
jgi:hypothetical protein